MIVVSDTSPLNYLALIGQADVLPILFKRVIAPPAVLEELLHSGTPQVVMNWATKPPAWLEIVAPSIVDPGMPLGRGESQAIALSQQLKADWILLDERKATIVARQLGLIVTGTLGVLSFAAERKLLALPEAIEALRQTNFRGPPELMAQLLVQDEERRARK